MLAPWGDLSAKPGGLSGVGTRLQASEAAAKGGRKDWSRRRLCGRGLEVSRDTNEGAGQAQDLGSSNQVWTVIHVTQVVAEPWGQWQAG